MTTASYRLHDGRRTITRGPLALVTGQAHQSARNGTPLFISDQLGNTIRVHTRAGTVWPTWHRPLEFFPAPALAEQPDWYCRLLALIVNLNDDHQPPPTIDLPPNTKGNTSRAKETT